MIKLEQRESASYVKCRKCEFHSSGILFHVGEFELAKSWNASSVGKHTFVVASSFHRATSLLRFASTVTVTVIATIYNATACACALLCVLEFFSLFVSLSLAVAQFSFFWFVFLILHCFVSICRLRAICLTEYTHIGS